MGTEGVSWELVFSALVGGLVALALKVLGDVTLDRYHKSSERKTEKLQKEMLLTMLDPDVMKKLPNAAGGFGVEWRTFDTLKSVIGAEDVTAKRLLLQIGARGSTKDGRSWALRRYQPLDPREAKDPNIVFKEDI